MTVIAQLCRNVDTAAQELRLLQCCDQDEWCAPYRYADMAGGAA